MADNPQKPGSPQTGRPLSPHLTIYHWAATMIVSISHRATGIALSVGALVLAWWLVAISGGPEAYQSFYAAAATPLGLVVLFGFTWSLAFHLLNGIRHLAWDLGYGFLPATAHRSALAVIALSLLLSAGVFAFVWSGHGGYLQ
jgi:succinate dehydrogenase / fumarate reductase cytochrome b subunit